MSERSYRGGAQIGWSNASWPFAKLTVSPCKLALTSFGAYEFCPSQVVSLEPYGFIPLLYNGIRINHNRADYPEKIIFWCMGSRQMVLEEIGRAGFSPQGYAVERPSGFPIRWVVVIAVVVLWNLLFMLDRSAKPQSAEPGFLVLVALFALFLFATSIRLLPGVQRIVLREGHKVGEVKALLGLLQLVTGFLLLIFGGMWIAHAYSG